MDRRNFWRSGRSALFLAGLFALSVGGLANWWSTLPDWRQDELLVRMGWQARRMVDRPVPQPRTYRYFASCNEARLAGYGSITLDEPSYRPELDVDEDGVACEPFPGRGARFHFRPGSGAD